MKITLSHNIKDVGVGIEANKEELNIQKMEELTRAYEAAQMLWKQYPEFKQVTLDTMTDEERKMIELSEHSNNQN